MLSILIPTYNFNVIDFVTDLSQQAKTCGIDFEILCFDDSSDEEFKLKNQSLKKFTNVTYIELPQNIGRSKIRNLLATEAKLEYLLFLDCDSKTNSSQFIANYLKHAKPNTVVYGGRNYESKPPKEKNLFFRWWYGINRETISVAERERNPYHSFMTNNFLIPKTLFLSIQLDEKLVGYGHEDTLFGIELKKKNIVIHHINNPLCHIGLESVDEYLQKTKEGIKNLHQLINSGKVDKTVKLYRFYNLAKKVGLETKILSYYNKNKNKLEEKFKKDKPNLKWFDLYKLGYLISLTKS